MYFVFSLTKAYPCQNRWSITGSQFELALLQGLLFGSWKVGEGVKSKKSWFWRRLSYISRAIFGYEETQRIPQIYRETCQPVIRHCFGIEVFWAIWLELWRHEMWQVNTRNQLEIGRRKNFFPLWEVSWVASPVSWEMWESRLGIKQCHILLGGNRFL